MSRLVLASHNRKKAQELTALLAPLGFTVLPVSDFSADVPDETAPTFVENALIKARHAARVSGLPALADDSGLEVPALGGAPGVYSARYAGEGATDASNNAKLIAAMAGLEGADRRARFVCCLALLRHADDPLPLLAEGIWEGSILREPRGSNGFGYDPLFWVPDAQCSSAELSADDKAARSHRGQALRALAAALAAGAR